MYTLGGVSGVANLLLMKSLNKTETPISKCNVFLISKGNLFYFYFTSLQLVLVPRLPVRQHSTDYIFISFDITGPCVVSLKMELCSFIR